ncbi:hypothetical protein AOL_s00004g592 [Orbilia oligospora ATCC 24927]|uniref:Uncharacterized protein n=1 Tax=Arthrobotrys oligospora (strain ATCC 24927 / CBS 115.81 / DSM 1491) TaxID=756982 RepID=G1WZ81_ARTOA|nr:hypothetical protein AOL_s00004g592 [Orbilia oligospora ATCC 24927]EGX53933.1 hypothetical protein AOL_s00004g592 [Orbilia oligospora ATCC 24927]
MDSEVCSHIARWFLVIVCYHACTIRADDGDEFSNNLFSDLAPLLALFGEQVAKQYLSQSLSWLDCVIFAMAPLGIITAIVSAIRVAGPAWLRAAIGRAREVERDAELEVMSSTSEDVCELWNGKRVVRLFGQPKFTEIFWLEKVGSDSQVQVCGDETSPRETSDRASARTQSRINKLMRIFKDSFERRLFVTPGHETSFELKRLSFGTSRFKGWRMKQENLKEIVPKNLVGTFFSAREARENGFIYQSQYPEAKLLSLEDAERSEPTVLPPTKPPNISLNLLGDPTSKVELAFVALITTVLQLGVVAFQIAITYLSPLNRGFTKGGNLPPSYACPLNVAGTFLVIMGMFICAMVVQWKSKEHICQVVADQQFDSYCLYHPEKRRKVVYSNLNNGFKTQSFWTIIGSFISIMGFVLQFTGLRGMNYSASLVQLGAIAIATALRVMIRRPISDKPETKKLCNTDVHESAAKIITSCTNWRVRNLIDTPRSSIEEFGGDLGLGTVDAMRKLQEISQWPPENTAMNKRAESLIRAIQGVVQYLHHSDIVLREEAKNETSFEFRIPVTYISKGGQLGEPKMGVIKIKMERGHMSPSNSTGFDWEIDQAAIKAVLKLWASGQKENEANSESSGARESLILLGPRSELNILDYEMFISYKTPCLKLENGLDGLEKLGLYLPESRVFGYVGTDRAEEHLACKTTMDLHSLHARHILTCCLNQLFAKIKYLKEQTRWARIVSSSEMSGPKNRNLLRVFDAFFQVIQDAKVAESTAIQPQVSIEEVFRTVIYAVRRFRENNHWLYVGDTLFGFLQCCHLVFGDEHKWSKLAHLLVSQICRSIEGEIYHEIGFQDEGDRNGEYWYRTCSNWTKHFQEAFGSQSSLAREMSLNSAFLRPNASRATVPATLPQDDPKTIAIELAWNGELLPKKDSITAIPSSTKFPTVNKYQGYPEALQRLVCAEDPRESFEDFIKPEPSFGSEITETRASSETSVWERDYSETNETKVNFESVYVIQVLNAAADLGNPKLVALCMAKLTDAFSKSILSTDSLVMALKVAASAAVKSRHGAVIDLMLSALGGNKAKPLEEALAPSGLNYLQKFFNPSLRMACKNGAIEIVHLILSGGIDPRLDGDFESQPLYLAARGGHTDIITLLFFYGVPSICDGPEGKNTFLHHAARYGMKKTLEFVVSSKLNLLSLLFIQDGQGNCPVETAIITGNELFAIQAFEAMLKNRQRYFEEPKPDAGKNHGQSLLHLACTHDLPELAKVIIAYGFQPHVVDERNCSAFQTAAAYGSCQVGKVLLEHDKKRFVSQSMNNSPILLAAEHDRTLYVKLLLENGVDIEVHDLVTGYTPLLAAAAHGRVNTIKLLLERGANILAKDGRGRTFMQILTLFSTLGLEGLDIIFYKHDANKERLELPDWTLVLTAMASDLPYTNLMWIFKRIDNNGRSLRDLVPDAKAGGILLSTMLKDFMISRLNETEKSLTNLYFKPYANEIKLMLPEAPADISQGFSKRSTRGFEDCIDLVLRLLKRNDPSAAASALDEKVYHDLLVYAAGTGCGYACERLLKYMKLNSHKEQLERALHLAFYGGRLDIVKILVDAGIQTNKAFQGSGLTPLSLFLRIVAVTRKNHGYRWETISFNDSFDIGPEPWGSDIDLLECLNLFLSPKMEVAPTPEELEDEQSLLHLAIMCKSPEVFATLVAFGVEINLPKGAKRPILHFALSYKPTDLSWIRILCLYGIDVNDVDRNGKTALSIAIEDSNTLAAEALIYNGAKWRQQETTPELIAAIKFGSSSHSLFSFLCKRRKMKMLAKEYRKYISSPMAYGSSPIHIAAKYHNDEILGFLWLEGADMHAKDKRGRNALSYALESRSTMQLLLNVCRVDPNERQCDQEYTAAHIAIRTILDPIQIAETLHVLWNFGADFNLKDKAGNTPANYITFASRRPKLQIRAVVLPSKETSNVAWEEDLDLSRQLEQVFDKYRSGDGGYSRKK